MSEEGPIVGNFETHLYVPWYWWPVNLVRILAGRDPIEKTMIVFKPKQPIVMPAGKAVELRFFEDGTVQAIGMEAESEQ